MTKQFATPGPRAIYPELCDSPSLGRCGLLANALFPRLIAQADDQGRLAGGAAHVMLKCLPTLIQRLTVNDVQEALAELEREGMIVQYSAADLIQITGWWSWQQSQRRAYPSRWPAPQGWVDLVYGAGKDEPETFAAAVRGTSRRNAALRGELRRIAASRVGPHAGPRTGPGARAMPGPTVPSPTVPSRGSAASSRPNGAAGGLNQSAHAILDDPASSPEAKAGAQAMLDLHGGRQT